MKYLEVALQKPDQPGDTTRVHFRLGGSRVAQDWARLVDEASGRNPVITSSWGMHADDSDTENIANDLNQHITRYNDLVNKMAREELNIPLYGGTGDDLSRGQDFLNRIHEMFDSYYHELGCNEPGAWENAKVKTIKFHLSNVNSLIHTMESILTAGEYARQGLVCAWFTVKLYAPGEESALLQNEDRQQFTTAENFGDLFLNYGRVGKSLYDMYISNDLELLSSGYKARPCTNVAPGMIALFGNHPKIHEDQLARFHEWWDLNNVDQYGYRKNDPADTIGLLKLGEFVANSYVSQFYDAETKRFDEFAVVRYYGPYSRVKGMTIVDQVC